MKVKSLGYFYKPSLTHCGQEATDDGDRSSEGA